MSGGYLTLQTCTTGEMPSVDAPVLRPPVFCTRAGTLPRAPLACKVAGEMHLAPTGRRDESFPWLT